MLTNFKIRIKVFCLIDYFKYYLMRNSIAIWQFKYFSVYELPKSEVTFYKFCWRAFY
jgi:hypothetical protein